MLTKKGWSHSNMMSFSKIVLSTWSISIKISFLIDLIAYNCLLWDNSARKTLPKAPLPSTMSILKSENFTSFSFSMVAFRFRSEVPANSLCSSVVSFRLMWPPLYTFDIVLSNIADKSADISATEASPPWPCASFKSSPGLFAVGV